MGTFKTDPSSKVKIGSLNGQSEACKVQLLGRGAGGALVEGGSVKERNGKGDTRKHAPDETWQRLMYHRPVGGGLSRRECADDTNCGVDCWLEGKVGGSTPSCLREQKFSEAGF